MRVAEGEPLGPEFDDVEPRGHAIEVRLYAEDPWQRFAPSPGRIELLRWPEGPGVRDDSGVYEGSEVSIHYDPMLAKLIVWAADRPRALDRLGRALAELRVEGIRTTGAALPGPARRSRLPFRETWTSPCSTASSPRGSCSRPSTAEDDLPLIAAALAHYERAHRTAAGRFPGRRALWAAAGRRDSRRGGS